MSGFYGGRAWRGSRWFCYTSCGPTPWAPQNLSSLWQGLVSSVTAHHHTFQHLLQSLAFTHSLPTLEEAHKSQRAPPSPCLAAPVPLILTSSPDFHLCAINFSLHVHVDRPPSPVFLTRMRQSRLTACRSGSGHHSHHLHQARVQFQQYWIRQHSSSQNRLKFWFACYFKIWSFFSTLHLLVWIDYLKYRHRCY